MGSRIGEFLTRWRHVAAYGTRCAGSSRVEELGIAAFGGAGGISTNNRGAARRDCAVERWAWAAGHQGERHAPDQAQRHGEGEPNATLERARQAASARLDAREADDRRGTQAPGRAA